MLGARDGWYRMEGWAQGRRDRHRAVMAVVGHRACCRMEGWAQGQGDYCGLEGNTYGIK